MKLNKEQITLLVVAAGLGWLAYDALTAAPVKAPAKSGRILVQESPDAPLGALADAMLAAEETTWSAEAKNIYRAPREESPLRRALFLPFAVVATPVVFGGDWLGRS